MSFSITYIGATWCSTCKVIKPKTEELAKKFSVPLKIMDLDDLEEEDKVSIRKVPTLRIFKGEEMVVEYIVKQVESLQTWLQQNVTLLASEASDDF